MVTATINRALSCERSHWKRWEIAKRKGMQSMRITKYRTELNENLHNVLVKENGYNYPLESVTSANAIAAMLNTIFRLNKQAEEHLYMVALNTKCRILGVFEVSHGTVNCSICNPRDIFIKALLCGATGIILAHNHPSQDTTPSKEDMETYRRVKESGRMIGIELMDNIILGNGYFSFHENRI